MEQSAGRVVTLVLVDEAGEPVGVLRPFEVATPWWQEVAEFGADVQVLRLLHADRPAPHGGAVTYLAQANAKSRNIGQGSQEGGVPQAGEATQGAEPPGNGPGRLAADLSPHPARAPYAEPGGPAASMAWARDALGRADVTFRQQRTWNLSAIWRIDGRDDTPVAWLKQVPSFFAHEPAAIALAAAVDPALVPRVLATGPAGRMLLAHVPGEDCYDAGPEVAEQVLDAFHPVQVHYATHPAPGVPEAHLDAGTVAEPYFDVIPGLRAFIEDLPRRLGEVEACGLPRTLVHGDLHLGNVRQDGRGRLTVIDWGDSVIDHPAYDIMRLTGGLPDPAPLLASWARRWRAAVPGCDPLRAVELLRPVAALRAAGVYQGFLDAIEPSEWPYHAADVPACLARATSIVEG